MEARQKILLAFSWGHRFPKPGTSNEAMAFIISGVKSEYKFILAQAEIADAMKRLNLIPDFVVGEVGQYLSSYQVASAMSDWIRKTSRNDELIEVLCHKTHWRGLDMILHRVGIQASRLNANVPYDRQSAQWYTRGPVEAFIGKIVHGFRYFFKGEI